MPRVVAEMACEGLGHVSNFRLFCEPLAGGPGVAKGRTQEDAHVVRSDTSTAQIWWMDVSIPASWSI
jgi:hypothetical protein